jgi:hypothetical protein
MHDITERGLIAEMTRLLEEVVFNDANPDSSQYNKCDLERCLFCADAARVLARAKTAYPPNGKSHMARAAGVE